ncbi:MAG: ATP-binding protein, partial [Bacteroidaceae bacterium]|nr:ATP-binding protein [Bacteroidaceae bacterium]
DKSYRSTLENKVETYKQFSNTRKAVHLTMITTYGLTPSAHNDIVQSTVAADDLFTPLPY